MYDVMCTNMFPFHSSSASILSILSCTTLSSPVSWFPLTVYIPKTKSVFLAPPSFVCFTITENNKNQNECFLEILKSFYQGYGQKCSARTVLWMDKAYLPSLGIRVWTLLCRRACCPRPRRLIERKAEEGRQRRWVVRKVMEW